MYQPRVISGTRIGPLRMLIILLAAVAVVGGIALAGRELTAIHEVWRTTPVFSPPVQAGQQVTPGCAGGFYARHGSTIVLTSTGHCMEEGGVALGDNGRTGIFGPVAKDADCPYPGHWCAPSDMSYVILDAGVIPWGHLNLVDMGPGGYHTLIPGGRPLSCADIAIGDQVEIDGHGFYRTGQVLGKGQNLSPANQDGTYFPCIIRADITVMNGDSGGSVLVRGLPAGASSRNFGGFLGFTPLAEGLSKLGLTLCTTPDCELTPATAANQPFVP